MACCAIVLSPHTSIAGVSAYLPLNLAPELETQIQRVLLLANKPILTRPIAVTTVAAALPKACAVDAELCASVGQYLQRYQQRIALTEARAEVSTSQGNGANITRPNQHGAQQDDTWSANASAQWNLSDYALVSVGAVANENDVTPTNTLLSLGVSQAQLDIGYRDRWWSPLQDSSLLISTEARTMPSVTLSNNQPFSWLGLQYEAFLALMSNSDRITYQGAYTSGQPRLAGLHLSSEPISGWAVGLNRIMQFGGGARGGNSLSDIAKAFFNPTSYDNTGANLDSDAEFGNQAASVTSQIMFMGKLPFSVVMEYAGEDTSHGSRYLLGNAALSLGIHWPNIGHQIQLGLEVSEWQNGWYVHHIYRDGLTNDGNVIGHWGGDARQVNNGVGARSAALMLGRTLADQSLLQLRYRTIHNQTYYGVDYRTGYDTALSYSHPWQQWQLGAELNIGETVFGDHYSRLSGSLGFTGGNADTTSAVHAVASGLSDTEVYVATGLTHASQQTTWDVDINTHEHDPHATYFAIGARRAVAPHHDLGVRLESEQILGHNLLSVRALDYRYRWNTPLALNLFFGAARYDQGVPAYGWYGGAGLQWRNLLPGIDLELLAKQHINLARDKLLASDPGGDRPDIFYDLNSSTLALSYHW